MDFVPLFSTIYFSTVAVALIAGKYVPLLDRFFQHGKLIHNDLKAQLPIFLNLLANISVPKSWFGYFYFLFLALMVVFSVFYWSTYTAAPPQILIWALLTLQAARRSLESIYLTKWSNTSRMHVFHFLVGIVFYVLISLIAFTGIDLSSTGSYFDKKLLTATDYIIACCFSLISFDQYSNHLHLAGLKKYTVPSYGLFKYVACAHYFDEILLYALVTILSFNWRPWSSQAIAFSAAWAFTLVNLSISAKETQKFYLRKFDEYHVKHSVIPCVY